MALPNYGDFVAIRLCGLSFLQTARGLLPFEKSCLIEIGYRLATAAWGQGAATEVGTRLLNYGLRELALELIAAVIHPENAASQNVIRKIGLRSDGFRFHYGLNLGFFSLDRDNYLTSR